MKKSYTPEEVESALSYLEAEGYIERFYDSDGSECVGRFVMPALALIPVLLLCSCSKKQDNNVLPVYSDMGAAEDAGKTKWTR